MWPIKPKRNSTPEQEADQERQRRTDACLAEIQASLAKHNCEIAGHFQVLGSQFSTGYVVVPK